jgi:hypothetical protein
MVTKKNIMMFFLIITCSTLHAEVYKWIDENGKPQFSDKPPAEKKAESIGQTLEKTNVDYGSGKIKKSVVFNKEKTEDEKNMEKKKLQKMEEEYGPRCKKMKEDIAAIARGDENGKEELVLERDRGKKLEEWKGYYQRSGCEKLYPLE